MKVGICSRCKRRGSRGGEGSSGGERRQSETGARLVHNAGVGEARRQGRRGGSDLVVEVVGIRYVIHYTKVGGERGGIEIILHCGGNTGTHYKITGSGN